MLFIGLFIVLCIPTGTWCQVSSSQNSPVQDIFVKDQEMVTEVVAVKYYPVEDLKSTISDIFGNDRVATDQRTNSLIINAAKDQMQSILNLIQQLDVEGTSSQVTQNVFYRIYMLEIPSPNQQLKPFSLVIKAPSKNITGDFLKQFSDDRLNLSDFYQLRDRFRYRREEPVSENISDIEQMNAWMIQGRAESNAILAELIDEGANAQLVDLKWDEAETFTNQIAAAQFSRLPENLQKHIQNFLGDSIHTVGYWFGNSSIPGEISAPIGLWNFKWESRLDRGSGYSFRINIEVRDESSSDERRPDRDQEIINNTVDGKIGAPIIICYNRLSYGTRKLGALVILPDADTLNATGE